MAVRGSKPKADGQKVTRVPLAQDWVDVPDAPYRGPRPILRPRIVLGVPVAWPAATKAWWETVSRQPHCVLWREGDWQFALDSARVHAAFVEGDLVRSQELRVRERQMGTTLDARRDLRIRYVTPEVSAPATATAAVPTDLDAARRRRLLEEE